MDLPHDIHTVIMRYLDTASLLKYPFSNESINEFRKKLIAERRPENIKNFNRNMSWDLRAHRLEHIVEMLHINYYELEKPEFYSYLESVNWEYFPTFLWEILYKISNEFDMINDLLQYIIVTMNVCISVKYALKILCSFKISTETRYIIKNYLGVIDNNFIERALAEKAAAYLYSISDNYVGPLTQNLFYTLLDTRYLNEKILCQYPLTEIDVEILKTRYKNYSMTLVLLKNYS